MDPPRLASRTPTILFETMMVLGWCAALWLALGPVIGDDRRDSLVRSLRYEARQLAEWFGILDEPDVVIVPDPVPPEATPWVDR
jgi:hypothetical protein